MCIQEDLYVLRNRTFWPKYIVRLCKQENRYILWKQLTYDSEKVAEQNSEKHPCFPRGTSYTAKGHGARYTWVRNHEHFSGNTESKATHEVSQPIFLSPGITASHPRKNTVILVAFEKLSCLLKPSTSLHPHGPCLGLSKDSRAASEVTTSLLSPEPCSSYQTWLLLKSL